MVLIPETQTEVAHRDKKSGVYIGVLPSAWLWNTSNQTYLFCRVHLNSAHLPNSLQRKTKACQDPFYFMIFFLIAPRGWPSAVTRFREIHVYFRTPCRAQSRTTTTIVSYNYYHISHPFLWVMRSSIPSLTTATASFLPYQRPADVQHLFGSVATVPVPFPHTKEMRFHFLPETT